MTVNPGPPPSTYRDAPWPTPGMPPGVPYIVGNEAAERFSYYGMMSILMVFMTQHLSDHSGQADLMNTEEATAWVHLFKSGSYFFPILGGLLAEVFWGKYRTIITLSLVYCVGHGLLALDATRLGLMLGLSLIALGAGGIKPCVSAHVGDQFGRTNQKLIPRVFSWFYVAINVGAAVGMWLVPKVLEKAGAHWAFGLPGLLMLVATVVFWMGRHRFVHIPAAGRKFASEMFSPVGLRALGRLGVIYLFVAMFWSLFDQTASRWVIQAQAMDRVIWGTEILPSQMQALNPVFILILVPVFSIYLYPTLARYTPVTPKRKIAWGLFLAVLSFLVPAWIQWRISSGETPSILWQGGAYLLITAAEILVSITCLEYSYTQAPNCSKSFIMGVYFLSVTTGNLFTAGINLLMDATSLGGILDGAWYYLFFAGMMLASAIGFLLVARRLREQTHLQAEAP